MVEQTNWWLYDEILEWGREQGFELRDLVEHLQAKTKVDYEQYNVVEFTPEQIVNIAPRDDGTFYLLLKDIDLPMTCQTIILQAEGESCLAVL